MLGSSKNNLLTKANTGSSAKGLKPSHKFSSVASGTKPIDRYVKEYRDYKSLAVGDYAPYQKAAMAKHQNDLRYLVVAEY